MSEQKIRWQSIYRIDPVSFSDAEGNPRNPELHALVRSMEEMEASPLGQKQFREIVEGRGGLPPSDASTGSFSQLRAPIGVGYSAGSQPTFLNVPFNKRDVLILDPLAIGTFPATERDGSATVRKMTLTEALIHENRHIVRNVESRVVASRITTIEGALRFRACEESHAIADENVYRREKNTPYERSAYIDAAATLRSHLKLNPDIRGKEAELLDSATKLRIVNQGCVDPSQIAAKDKEARQQALRDLGETTRLVWTSHEGNEPFVTASAPKSRMNAAQNGRVADASESSPRR